MKIVVLGAGFAGLSAAYYLRKAGHDVTVLEKEKTPGGLAMGFKEKDWDWSLEKHYHHFFTNDTEFINLAREIGIDDKLVYPASLTSVLENGKIYPFNTPFQILSYSPLPFVDRVRLGVATLICKLLPMSFGLKLERYTAYEFSRKIFGLNVFNSVWKPLLDKKFGDFREKVNAGWLWGRIRKRTLKLGYVAGGFQAYADALYKKCKDTGVKVYFGKEIIRINQTGGKWEISVSLNKNEKYTADKVISTLPTPVFTGLFTTLPLEYKNQLSQIPHLHALNMVLVSDKPFLSGTYWLNVNDPKFPFLCVVQHTNYIDKKNYGGKHILYIGNYLPFNHEFFRKTPNELFNGYKPFLAKINPDFNLKIPVSNIKLFTGYFAQPVFEKNYSDVRPFGKTPLPNLYFANLDSVYPWDRGTNYAIEVGRKIGEMVINS